MRKPSYSRISAGTTIPKADRRRLVVSSWRELAESKPGTSVAVVAGLIAFSALGLGMVPVLLAVLATRSVVRATRWGLLLLVPYAAVAWSLPNDGDLSLTGGMLGPKLLAGAGLLLTPLALLQARAARRVTEFMHAQPVDTTQAQTYEPSCSEGMPAPAPAEPLLAELTPPPLPDSALGVGVSAAETPAWRQGSPLALREVAVRAADGREPRLCYSEPS